MAEENHQNCVAENLVSALMAMGRDALDWQYAHCLARRAWTAQENHRRSCGPLWSSGAGGPEFLSEPHRGRSAAEKGENAEDEGEEEVLGETCQP